MLTIESRMVNNFLAHRPISYKYKSFCYSILKSTPNLIPLTGSCPFKICNQIRPAYLRTWCSLSRVLYIMSLPSYQVELYSRLLSPEHYFLATNSSFLASYVKIGPIYNPLTLQVHFSNKLKTLLLLKI